MFNTVLEFLATVPIHNSMLRAIIMVAEMFALGFILYHLWEVVPRLPRIGKMAATFMVTIALMVIFPVTHYSKMSTSGYGKVAGSTDHPKKDIGDKEDLDQFADIFSDLVM